MKNIENYYEVNREGKVLQTFVRLSDAKKFRDLYAKNNQSPKRMITIDLMHKDKYEYWICYQSVEHFRNLAQILRSFRGLGD